MDNIKEQVEKVVKNLLADSDLMKKFDKDPVKVIEKLLGVDLPDDLINEIVKLVKVQIQADKVGDALDALGGLFGKKK